jgi:hypothetical protein
MNGSRRLSIIAWFAFYRISREEKDGPAEEYNAGKQHRHSARQQNSSVSDLKSGLNSGSLSFIHAPVDALEGTLEQFGNQNERDAGEKAAPLNGTAAKDSSGCKYYDRKEEMPEKAGVAAHS